MSHFVNIVTEIKDKKALVKALERMGFKNKLEIYDTPHQLMGYLGDLRKDKAHIIIRKKHVGNSSNDIGFERRPDGRFVSHISEFDQGKGSYASRTAKYGDKWQQELCTYYGVEKAKMEYDKMGLKYTEEIDEKKRIRLRATIGC